LSRFRHLGAKCVHITGTETPYFYVPVGSLVDPASGKKSIVQTWERTQLKDPSWEAAGCKPES